VAEAGRAAVGSEEAEAEALQTPSTERRVSSELCGDDCTKPNRRRC
jgi:hypothetical protein